VLITNKPKESEATSYSKPMHAHEHAHIKKCIMAINAGVVEEK
jgi:hypothetical protein